MTTADLILDGLYAAVIVSGLNTLQHRWHVRRMRRHNDAVVLAHAASWNLSRRKGETLEDLQRRTWAHACSPVDWSCIGCGTRHEAGVKFVCIGGGHDKRQWAHPDHDPVVCGRCAGNIMAHATGVIDRQTVRLAVPLLPATMLDAAIARFSAHWTTKQEILP